MNISDAIQVVEYGDEDTDFNIEVEAYQTLINAGLIWNMGPCYAEQAQYLIDFQVCHKGN
jgi:hypothetical protein